MTTPTTVQVKFQLRGDTAANWASVNPVLLNNELGLETDTKKLKVGNGSTAWNSLAYFPSIVTGGTVLGNLEIGTTGTLTFEGSTADGFETTLGVINPSADRTINLPNQSGTVIVSGNATIVDADIAANAEIAVSKLADGTARQLLQTDAAGTGVEWTSNVDIPGTLDVTGAATFDAAVTIAGDLTVNGTTTNINTTNLVVEDKNIILGDVTTPSDITADGGGITLKGGATDKTINWVDATDAWTSSERFSYPLGSATAPALTFTGDANSGVYSPGADQVSVATGGNERLRIDSTGQIEAVSLGTAAAPAYSWTDDPDSGLYSVGDNQVAISTGGTERLAVDSSGNVVISNNANYRGKDNTGTARNLLRIDSSNNTVIGTAASSNRVFIEGAGTGEAIRIDGSGRLLVGTSTTPPAIETLTPGLVRSGAGSAVDEYSAGLYCYRNAGGSGRQTVAPRFFFARSRSAVNNATGGVVLDNDDLGNIRFAGDDGTNFITAAEILAEVDGTPGTNDMPGRIVLSTTPDGTATPVERFRITNDGVIAHDQPAPAAVNATATLTIANLKTGIITSTSAAATDMTLPTGTDTQAGFVGTYDNFTFEWSVINTGPSLVRVLAGTAHTIVGSGSVATGTSGRFASRRTAANTFVTYRLS
jgi:hypothetical protein